MQPTAQAVGGKWNQSKPRRGEREAMTETPEGRLKFSRTLERPAQFSSCCMGKPGTGKARLHRLQKESVLHLILGGAAVYRCGKSFALNSAFQASEKLRFRIRVSL
jgi:hypothetical protein